MPRRSRSRASGPERNPLGVLAYELVTLGIYFLYWYYKISGEVRMVPRRHRAPPRSWRCSPEP